MSDHKLSQTKEPLRILITGGWGTTARRLATILNAEETCSRLILTSRSGRVPAPFEHRCVRFDWFDEGTYDAIFQTDYGGIDRAYLVAPPTNDLLRIMKPFIDLCILRGVSRIVFLSGSLFDETTGLNGEVHKYIASLGVDYCVLRPTYFMENFSEQEQKPNICYEDKLISGAQDGKSPWVSAEDVAAVAARVLVSDDSPNTDLLVLGPQLLSYDEIATKLTETLGRRISHVSMDRSDFTKHLMNSGYPLETAELFADLDTLVAVGKDAIMNDVVKNLTGKPPKMLADFIEENKHTWEVQSSSTKL